MLSAVKSYCGNIVGARNFRKRLLVGIAALDRLAPPCGEAMPVEMRLGQEP